MTSLNAEELDLLESVENDEWRSIPNLAQELQRYQGYAQSQAITSLQKLEFTHKSENDRTWSKSP